MITRSLKYKPVKYILTVIMLLSISNDLFAQNKVIDKSDFFDENSLHVGKVKSMIVKKSIIRANSMKKDTTVTLKSFEFSKQQFLKRLIVYDKSIDKEYNIVEFYKNGEIKQISRRENGVMMLLRTQLFKNNTTQAYRINEYYASVLTGFYISTFKDKLVVKREHFIKDTLSEWNEYRYDKENRIVEEKYFSADNPNHETMLEKEKYNLSWYPEHLINYSYKKKLDTLITIKDRISVDKEEIRKRIKNEFFTLEIIEKYDKLKLNDVFEIYKTKDSTSEKMTFYEKDGTIRSQRITYETPNLIISTYKNFSPIFNTLEQKTITAIDTVTDTNGNWTKKIYKENDEISKVIFRQIEYYN
jgi:hypothetical protein